MNFQLRPLLHVYREALRTLQSEPGPMTSNKLDLMTYLRQRITEHESRAFLCE